MITEIDIKEIKKARIKLSEIWYNTRLRQGIFEGKHFWSNEHILIWEEPPIWVNHPFEYFGTNFGYFNDNFYADEYDEITMWCQDSNWQLIHNKPYIIANTSVAFNVEYIRYFLKRFKNVTFWTPKNELMRTKKPTVAKANKNSVGLIMPILMDNIFVTRQRCSLSKEHANGFGSLNECNKCIIRYKCLTERDNDENMAR